MSGRGTGRSGGGSGRGGGARDLTVRVRTAKKRKTSSTRWLKRQLNDPYVVAAKREGYRARSAFKLIEIDERYKLIRPGGTVVDLGAAPGGWSQVAVEKTGAASGGGRVVAIDITDIDPIAGVGFLQGDITDPANDARIIEMLGGAKADLVMSDMAAPATGHRQSDHLRTMVLCEAGFDFAQTVLAPGGAYLAKVLQGGTVNDLLARMKKSFATVRHVKPKASRADSTESYVLATGFRPPA